MAPLGQMLEGIGAIQPDRALLQGGGRNLGAHGAHNIPFGEWLVSIHG